MLWENPVMFTYCGEILHYENKTNTKTFRPTDLLHIFTKL